MKNKITLWLASAAFAAIIFSSCSKEQTQVSSASQTASEYSLSEIDVLGNQADEAFANIEITGGTETEDFAVTNGGIPDAYQVTESTADEINSAKRDGNARRLRACLGQLELSREQVAKIRVLFRTYEDCNKYVLNRHRNAMNNLTDTMNAKLKRLNMALREGKITKAQYEAGIKALRVEFNRIAAELASKSRAALKECYTRMLRGLNQILTERQWKAFVNCYRI